MDAELTLFGDSISGNCMKPKWVCDLHNIQYKWVEVSVLDKSTRTERFLSMNPAGQVPVARFTDGRILAQSNAIMIYLAESVQSALIPPDSFTRAKMYSWLFWEQYSHEPYIAVRRFQKLYLNMDDADINPALLQKGYAALAILDSSLSNSAFLVGKTMSLADVGLLAYTRLAPEGGFNLDNYTRLTDWITRCENLLSISN